jgi:type I restriction enzyme M protein
LVISEAVFNRKLNELAKIYRNINFENNIQKIDFTIGFISLEYFEEKEKHRGKLDKATILYWSNCSNGSENCRPDTIVGNLIQYIGSLRRKSQFSEFGDLMEKVRIAIFGKDQEKPLVSKDII